jgi:PAS domain-containing protein
MMGRASGKWSIQLSRAIRDGDGKFGGVIIASLDPDFIREFYESVNPGSHGTIILRRLDGVILASCGLQGPSLGRQAVLQPLTDAVVEPPRGHYWGRANIDGVARLIAYRFDAKFPIIETVGRAESDIFEAYLHDRNTYIGIAVLITILALIAIAGGAHYQIRLDRVRDNLRCSEAQAIERARALELKSRELEVTLDYMGQGIIMTDADDNVRVTNRQAITLLGLPESFRFDRPMTKALVPDPAKPEASGLAVGLLIDKPRKPGAGTMDIQVYQRTLPDGIVLEIRSAPLQEGGRCAPSATSPNAGAPNRRSSGSPTTMPLRDWLTALCSTIALIEPSAVCSVMRRTLQSCASISTASRPSTTPSVIRPAT